MLRAEVLAMLEQHQRSFASRNPVRLAADHALDGTFESPAASVVRGRAAIEEVYRYWIAAFPDMDFTWHTPVVDGTRASFFWQFRGTLMGEFFGHSHPGARIQFPGAAEYDLSPEGIARARHVFDFTGALVSTGVLKAKPAD
jgi:hypothetical protein